jgi:hypothetical protein
MGQQVVTIECERFAKPRIYLVWHHETMGQHAETKLTTKLLTLQNQKTESPNQLKNNTISTSMALS